MDHGHKCQWYHEQFLFRSWLAAGGCRVTPYPRVIPDTRVAAVENGDASDDIAPESLESSIRSWKAAGGHRATPYPRVTPDTRVAAVENGDAPDDMAYKGDAQKDEAEADWVLTRGDQQ